MNIICSSTTSLSSLIEKVIFYCTLYLESHARYRKSRKLEKPFLDLSVSNFHFRRLIKGLNHSFSVSYQYTLFLLLVARPHTIGVLFF